MRRAAHTDVNHKAIREALRAAGYTVVDTASLGDGFPDLVVIAPDGRVCLMEVKTVENMRAGKIENEVHFMLQMVNPAYRIVTDVEQAVEIMRGFYAA